MVQPPDRNVGKFRQIVKGWTPFNGVFQTWSEKILNNNILKNIILLVFLTFDFYDFEY